MPYDRRYSERNNMHEWQEVEAGSTPRSLIHRQYVPQIQSTIIAPDNVSYQEQLVHHASPHQQQVYRKGNLIISKRPKIVHHWWSNPSPLPHDAVTYGVPTNLPIGHGNVEFGTVDLPMERAAIKEKRMEEEDLSAGSSHPKIFVNERNRDELCGHKIAEHDLLEMTAAIQEKSGLFFGFIKQLLESNLTYGIALELASKDDTRIDAVVNRIILPRIREAYHSWTKTFSPEQISFLVDKMMNALDCDRKTTFDLLYQARLDQTTAVKIMRGDDEYCRRIAAHIKRVADI
jgi:hypothetical protein